MGSPYIKRDFFCAVHYSWATSALAHHHATDFAKYWSVRPIFSCFCLFVLMVPLHLQLSVSGPTFFPYQFIKVWLSWFRALTCPVHDEKRVSLLSSTLAFSGFVEFSFEVPFSYSAWNFAGYYRFWSRLQRFLVF